MVGTDLAGSMDQLGRYPCLVESVLRSPTPSHSLPLTPTHSHPFSSPAILSPSPHPIPGLFPIGRFSPSLGPLLAPCWLRVDTDVHYGDP